VKKGFQFDCFHENSESLSTAWQTRLLSSHTLIYHVDTINLTLRPILFIFTNNLLWNKKWPCQ